MARQHYVVRTSVARTLGALHIHARHNLRRPVTSKGSKPYEKQIPACRHRLADADGTDLGVSLKYQYDLDRFSSDGGRFEDAQANRRKKSGVYLKRKGVYDATVVYDFQAKTWLDTYLRVQSKAVIGSDIGAFRVGFSKTPVDFEGNISTGATTFLEAALPTQAIYASRRIGVDWALERPHYLLDAGYYSGGDLNGDSDGRMLAGRVAWVPLNQPGHVLHLGISASRESPDGTINGRDVHIPPGARLCARPEAALLSQTTGRLRQSRAH